jgi:hypothetical protein
LASERRPAAGYHLPAPARGGIFGGGAWSVDGGAGSNVLVHYSDLRIALGAEIASFHGRLTTLEAGYVFSRDISVESVSLATPDSTYFLQATMAF